MKFNPLHIALLFILLACRVGAQISPGDLTKAHADLEGIYNCTKCHVLGDKVSNDKCLSCHQEIKLRVDRGVGFHASREAKGKECVSCHSDHHGRDFDIVRFDKNKFSHGTTGYELTGKHKTIDCRECHQPDFISDQGLKKRRDTYLGLSQGCASCHTDNHQKTLSNDCAKCHTTTAFAPASNFDHSKTDFALQGGHRTVACIDCHKKETKNGKAFQRFAGVPFSNCNSCHKDPHEHNLGTNCKECHVEQSFTAQTGLKKFNHGQTLFPLKGKHQQVDCAKCHNIYATPTTIFQDRLGVQTNNCVACHKDPHENKFGQQCTNCHSEKTFQVSGVLKDFDHNKTGFGLEGKHKSVDCKKCHTADSFTDPVKHYACNVCHKDYHEGEFTPYGIGPDCNKCHTVNGFAGSLYTIADHKLTKFPLEGGHIATPCIACHKKETTKWKFKEIGSKCADCHKDVHEGFIDKKFYPNQSCETCHISSSWADNHFDHNLTKFKLSGAHAKQACAACHGKGDENTPFAKKQKFSNIPSSCTDCHKNVHGKQFEKNGITDCVACHGSESWKTTKFNHNKAAFKLDGKHAKVSCDACHKKKEINGEFIVQYKFKSFLCVDCHQ